MKNKKIIYFAILIISLLAISCVNASDVDDAVIASEDTDQINDEVITSPNDEDIDNANEALENSMQDIVSEEEESVDSISASNDDNNFALNAQESNNEIGGETISPILTSAQNVDYDAFTILIPAENGVYKVGEEISPSIIPKKFIYHYGSNGLPTSNDENQVVLYYYCNGESYGQPDGFTYTKSDLGNFLGNYSFFYLTKAGTYKVVAKFEGEIVGEYTFKVKKGDTSLSANKVTATYSVSKKLVVTLKDWLGYALVSKKVTIKVGTISKTLTTNSEGQVSFDVSKLVPNTYTVTISFAGDNNYLKSSKKVKVVVKKATPKMTAKAKTFKLKVKTKKYKITLKNNKGKVMKSTKVSLKVKGKIYKAKTNKKGVATFKITNLNKRASYKAVVTYAGNKYYKKVTKKPKITVK